MAYPDYLAAKNPPSNSANVDFSGIDLTPENVENITQNLEIIDPVDPDPNAQTDPNQGGTEDPNAQTDPNQGGTEDPNAPADPNQGGEQPQAGTVTATIFVDTWGNGERWPKIADKLAQAGLIPKEETDEFVETVNKLGYAGKLQPGTYELTNTSYEDMIKVICRIK